MKTKIFLTLMFATSFLFAQKADVNFHSYSYLDYDYQLSNFDSNDDSTENTFKVDAFYFGAKAKISDKLSSRFTLKLTTMQNDVVANNYIYAKYAYLNYKFTNKFNMRFGVIDSSIQHFTNKFWGKRYISENFGAKNKIWNSANVGLSLRYNFGDVLNASLDLINGSGFKFLKDNDENKELTLTLTSKIAKYLYLALHGDYTIAFTGSNSNFKGTAFLGFKNSIVAIGYGLLLKNEEDVMSLGHSIYSTLTFADKYSLHLAMLYYDENTDADNDTNLKIITGVNYIYSKNFSFALSTELEQKYIAQKQSDLATKVFVSTFMKF